MSVPPRTKVQAQIKPVHARILISLPHALRLHGFIDEPRNCDVEWAKSLQEVASLWAGKRPLTHLWGRLGERGWTQETLEQKAIKLQGFRIGVRESFVNEVNSVLTSNVYQNSRICSDLATTFWFLSRSVGPLFLSYRDPDYSWEALFGSVFIVQDPALEKGTISKEQWPLSAVVYKPNQL